MGYIMEPGRKIPVIGEYDLCVLGGGCTGVFAAIRAARLGLRVAVVEKSNCFGGACTLSQINTWHSIYDFDFNQQIIGGLTTEVLEQLHKRGELTVCEHKINMFQFNSEELKIELDHLVEECGIQPFFHTLYVRPFLTDHRKMDGVFVENKDGRGILLAQIFIDATGDGDLCRDLKLEKFIDFSTIMPASPCFRLYKNKEYPIYITELIKKHGKEFGLENDWGWNIDIPGIPHERLLVETHVFDFPCLSADNITRCETIGRKQIRAVVDLLRKYMPDGDPVRIASIASSIGVRESYRYQTMYCLKDVDVLGVGEKFPDAVLNSSYPMDIHHPDSHGVTMRYLNGVQKTYNREAFSQSTWKTYSGDYPQFWQAPYRCMLIKEMDNVLLSGRMIDCEHGAFSALRVRINLNQLGEAAGIAAFLAAKNGANVKSIDYNQLLELLEKGGSIILKCDESLT